MEYILFLLGIIFNLPIGWFALKKDALTIPGGLTTAGVVGYLLFVIQPLYWVLLLVFFGSSTLLTRYKEDASIKVEAMALAEKGGQRDSFQVLANALIPVVLATVALFIDGQPSVNLLAWYSVSLAIAFAVVNADTWATEFGVTSTEEPRWILNPRKTVPRGTSGGVSSRGLLASLLAGIVIAVVYLLGMVITKQVSFWLVLLIIIGGLLGSLADSFLGATFQAQYYCPSCEKLTEQSFHQRCGTAAELQRGHTWFTNDLVNFLAVIVAILLVLPFLG